jgi:limonene-1,2-epoxide hydrolase
MDDHRIRDLPHLLSLWKDIYTPSGKPCWDGMLPYYDDEIHFRDSVQEIRGIRDFAAMTRRLAQRSKGLEFLVHDAVMDGDLAFVEWEMVISYKRYPKTSIYGASRLRLKDGKVIEQRDYYDLWGDILRNVRFLAKGYRRFMRRRFG